MHYGSYDFADDPNQLTLETIDPAKQNIIGQRDAVSFSDLTEINTVYE